MYTEEAITKLVDRIGWSNPIEMTNITLSADNLKHDSGRFFDAFHKLVTASNVLATVPDPSTDNTVLNAYLYSLKVESVRKVLASVFDMNTLAHFKKDCHGKQVDVSNTDYSSLIIAKTFVLDEAYGLQMAVSVLEMMISSARSNMAERVIKEAIPEIEGALNGYYLDGKQVEKGLRGMLYVAVSRAIKILFPQDEPLSTQPKIRDKSHAW